MGELLEELHRLQDLELKLAAIRQARNAKVRQVDIGRRKLRQVEEQLAAQQIAVRDLQIIIDSLSLDVASREESILKHREALTKARTNKEYAAILTAMNTEKADNMKIEAEALQKMEDIQALKDQQAELESQRGKLLDGVARAEGALKAADEESSGKRIALEAQRDEHADCIDATAMASFRRVAEKHDGEALASVERLHPKRHEFVCSGCNMQVSLEIVNVLQGRNQIQLCDVCGRILYLPPQSSPAQKARA